MNTWLLLHSNLIFCQYSRYSLSNYHLLFYLLFLASMVQSTNLSLLPPFLYILLVFTLLSPLFFLFLFKMYLAPSAYYASLLCYDYANIIHLSIAYVSMHSKSVHSHCNTTSKVMTAKIIDIAILVLSY